MAQNHICPYHIGICIVVVKSKSKPCSLLLPMHKCMRTTFHVRVAVFGWDLMSISCTAPAITCTALKGTSPVITALVPEHHSGSNHMCVIVACYSQHGTTLLGTTPTSLAPTCPLPMEWGACSTTTRTLLRTARPAVTTTHSAWSTHL